MPIYAFRCDRCGTAFEELVPSMETAAEVACPACSSRQVRKQISLIASRGGGRSPAAPAQPACGPGT